MIYLFEILVSVLSNSLKEKKINIILKKISKVL